MLFSGRWKNEPYWIIIPIVEGRLSLINQKGDPDFENAISDNVYSLVKSK
jgi:hypothetical protein